MNIQDISLLTVSEYNKYMNLIPKIEKSWWLQDKGDSGCFYIVSWLDGEPFEGGYYAGQRYVRPVLRVTDVKYQPGEKAAIFAHSWTALDTIDGVTLLLCDSMVTLRRFDKVENRYEGSEIQQWLRNWLAKRQKTTDNAKHKCYKRMNDIGMAYNANPFLNTWLFPMLFLLPIATVFFFYTQAFNGITIPEVILKGMRFGAVVYWGLIAAISALTTLVVVGGPHKDTGLRHLLNLAALITVFVFYRNTVTVHGITVLILAATIAAINHRYLQVIKYHS